MCSHYMHFISRFQKTSSLADEGFFRVGGTTKNNSSDDNIKRLRRCRRNNGRSTCHAFFRRNYTFMESCVQPFPNLQFPSVFRGPFHLWQTNGDGRRQKEHSMICGPGILNGPHRGKRRRGRRKNTMRSEETNSNRLWTSVTASYWKLSDCQFFPRQFRLPLVLVSVAYNAIHRAFAWLPGNWFLCDRSDFERR